MCTTLLVGRARSATGHVLLAHSEELGRNAAHQVAVTPARVAAPGERFVLHSGGDLAQAPRLARYLYTRIHDKRSYPGEHTAGVNEHGVAAVNDMAMMRGIPEARMFDVVPGGVIWTEFIQLVLERATSAREGATLVGEMCERHGLSCDSGTIIAIVDPDEAWWVELARGGRWAAQRVDDHEVKVLANCYRIPDFARELGDPANQQDRYNLDRHDAVEARLAALPLVGVRDLTRILRDVYEGTPLYCPRPDGSPFRTGRRTVARLNTEVSVVVEPRRNLPAAMAHRVWCCLSTSLSGVFVPFHVGIDRVEEHYALAGGRYDPRSAYWLFTELAKLVDYKYRACAEVVRATWQHFEDKTARALADEELRWASLAPDDLREAVTDFDGRTAGEAIHALENLLAEVKTRAFYEDF